MRTSGAHTALHSHPIHHNQLTFGIGIVMGLLWPALARQRSNPKCLLRLSICTLEMNSATVTVMAVTVLVVEEVAIVAVVVEAAADVVIVVVVVAAVVFGVTLLQNSFFIYTPILSVTLSLS